jgi:hypothetical protein
MRYRARFLGKGLLALLAVALLGGIVMVLWNAVVPGVFIGTRTIDYLHALGLLVLSRLLFGGFRGRGGWRHGRHWRRWEAMTAEERAQFQQSTSAGCKRREDRT